MDKNRIEEGDTVHVYFERMDSELNLTVLWTPCDTGDSWRFKRTDGTIIYMQNFAKMMLVKKGEG
jgi:hypothetical protein